MSLPEFFNSDINREYRRWMGKIGVGETDADANVAQATLSLREVLHAHFLVAEFFADESGLGGVGPRDRNGDLLQSALSRQFTGYQDARKWSKDYQIAATVLFGLVKNHPFHDGNKRTALLSVLYLLEKQGHTANEDKRRFENLTVAVADNRHRQNSLYKYLRGGHDNTDNTEDDADIEYIAARLQQMTRPLDRSHRALTYRQLNGLLKSTGYEMKDPHDNRISIVRNEDGQVIGRVGFPGMSKEVSKSDVKKVRRFCRLSEHDGYDSKAFYNGAGGMDSLLVEYAAPLRRLADK